MLVNGKKYSIIKENDNSLKQLFERFYIIPKDHELIEKKDIKILEKYACHLTDDLVSQGKNGYIVFRGKKNKSLTPEQVKEILKDKKLTQRELAFKYDVGVTTINRVKQGQY